MEVRPRERARSGAMMTSSGSMPSWSMEILAQGVAAGAVLPPVEAGVEGFAGDGFYCGIEESGAAQVEHDFGESSGEEDLDGGEVARAVGERVDQAGTWRLMCAQSAATGRLSPAAWAMAGRCRRRLVDPPKAAWTTMAFSTEAWVRMSECRGAIDAGAGWRVAERRAASSQMGCAGGGERGVGQGEAEGFGDDLRGGGGAEELAAAAGCGAGAAADLGGVFEGDLVLGEAGADGLDLACVFSVFG